MKCRKSFRSSLAWEFSHYAFPALTGSPHSTVESNLNCLSWRCVAFRRWRTESAPMRSVMHIVSVVASKRPSTVWAQARLIREFQPSPILTGEVGDTICRIALVGIENVWNGKKAAAIDLRFYHINGALCDPDINPESPVIVGGYRGYSPSPTVGHLVVNQPKEDERLSAYRRPIREPNRMTLQDALEGAKALILAHSDPEAIKIDAKCLAVGGHIHAATITPDEGFQWVIAPQTSNFVLDTSIAPSIELDHDKERT